MGFGILLFVTGFLVDMVTAFDFSKDEQVEAWTIVDDGVMGGVSQGFWYQEDDYAVFEGNVSLDNNGGFSSVRIALRPVDVSAYDGIALQVRGDGLTYGFGLRDRHPRYDYRMTFETTEQEDDEWEMIYIPFEELTATFFGREIPTADPFDPSYLRGMNLIISDGQEGLFRLEVASISLYREREADA